MNVPQALPIVDETLARDFTHGGSVEFSEDDKNDRFFEVDAKVGEVLHTPLHTDHVGFVRFVDI